MRTRLRSILLVLCMVVTMLPTNVCAATEDADLRAVSATDGGADIWDGSVAASYAGGSGIAGDPYQIATAAQLARVAEQVNSGAESEKHYRLLNDIYLNDITSVSTWDIAAPKNSWTPIGTSSTPFSGNFDGTGHTIWGLYISTADDYQGLFGSVAKDSPVYNLGIEASYVKGGNYVGALFGYTISALDRCHSQATVIGYDYCGGVAGGTGTLPGLLGPSQLNITNCSNKGDIRGVNYVGGIFGDSEVGYVTDCYNAGTVNGAEQVGGIGGRAMNSNRCWNAGRVIGSWNVGGIIGEGAFYGGTSSSLSSSFNAGEVSGDSYVGGILGHSTVYSGLYPSYIQNCYNVGKITGTGDYIGGIAGQGHLCVYTNCYNAGACSFGSGSNIGAISTYGVRQESGNLYYLDGCCGENYTDWASSIVSKKNVSEMQEAGFVADLNNGGTAWLQDTNGYNSGYPILSGIDYTLYWNTITSLNSYRLVITGDKQTNCLALNDRLEVYAGWYLGDRLDTSMRDSIVVTSNSKIIDIAIGDWNDRWGRQ